MSLIIFHRLQRPNTFHYVVTLDHSIAEGHHYYQASTIQDSVHQIVHSFIHKFNITNQVHDSAPSLLRRLLTATVDYYLSSYAPEGEFYYCI
jgi:hypothetical protein